MAPKNEKNIQTALLFLVLFLCVLACASVVLILFVSVPLHGVNTVSRRITVITALDKMIVSAMINMAQLLMIIASATALVVLLVNMRRRIDRLSDRVQELMQHVQSSVTNAEPDASSQKDES